MLTGQLRATKNAAPTYLLLKDMTKNTPKTPCVNGNVWFQTDSYHTTKKTRMKSCLILTSSINRYSKDKHMRSLHIFMIKKMNGSICEKRVLKGDKSMHNNLLTHVQLVCFGMTIICWISQIWPKYSCHHTRPWPPFLCYYCDKKSWIIFFCYTLSTVPFHIVLCTRVKMYTQREENEPKVNTHT